MVQGYGQTECVAPCTLTVQGDAASDNVGPPLPCNNVKLVDMPDMDYWAHKGQGEVCIKGGSQIKSSLYQLFFLHQDQMYSLVTTEIPTSPLLLLMKMVGFTLVM